MRYPAKQNSITALALSVVIAIAAAAVHAQVPKLILNEELGLAARTGDAERVREILELGADAAARDLFGQPIVVLASLKTYDNRHQTIIDLLLKKGADIDAANPFGTTPLMVTQTASRYNSSDEYFRKRGADFSRTDMFGGNYEFYYLFGTQPTYPPFAEKGKARLLTEREIIWRYVLENNLARLEDPKCCGRMGNSATVVMALAYYGYSDLFEEAVRKDRSLLGERDSYGSTALHYAAQGNCDKCVYLGFDNKDGYLELRDNWGETPLIRAAKFGHDLFIFKMLRLGAETDLKDSGGNSALGYAAAYGRDEAALALLAAGADSSAPAFEGLPALIAAAKAGHEKVVGTFATSKALAVVALRKGGIDGEEKKRMQTMAEIDLDIRGRDGRTALMLAAARGSLKMAQFLVYSGADLRLKDGTGRTALDLARESGNSELVKLLENPPGEAEILTRSVK
ncbi:MAG: ankyrin repeat domain-containing protein [Acidobacteriota bacterium]|nr:MAG: ankyrin repeat domain-containing protein [Acidobacteriota bacterium]